MVVFLYRPEYYKIDEDETGNSLKGVGEVIIAKHRNGSLDSVFLKFIGKYTKFCDLEGVSFNTGGDYGNSSSSNEPPSRFGSKLNTLESNFDNEGGGDDKAPF